MNYPTGLKWVFWLVGVGLMLGLPAWLPGLSRADDPPLTITVSHVSSRDAFPQVTARITVLDQNGLPVPGLSESDFQILIEGLRVPASAITVDADPRHPLDLVLALDLSLDQQADIEHIKAAALAFVDSLSPQDHLTLLTFYDTVEAPLFQGPVQPEQLQQIIANLEPAGKRTAFYQVTSQTLDLLARRSTLPKAAIILTNVGNNVDTLAADKAKAKVIEADRQIPVHIISFGHKARVNELNDVTTATGGQFYLLSTADELPVALSRLAILLRQGYTIAFQPALPNNTTGTDKFLVQVLNKQGRVAGQSSAMDIPLKQAQPEILLFGVQDVYLGETLVVTAAVSALPAANVSYQINDQTPVVRAASPYPLVWASAGNAPGEYSLTVTVTDPVGNQVKAAPAVFRVLEPAAIPVTQVYWGDPIMLQANVNALALPPRVEFWLDEQLLAALDAPPYELTWTSTNQFYPPKPTGAATHHTLKIKTTNDQGQTTESWLKVTFLKPPLWLSAFKPNWRMLASGTILAAATLVLLPWLFFSWRKNSRRQQARLGKTCRLTLKNQGNTPTAFRLSATALQPDRALIFQFSETSQVSPTYVPPEMEYQPPEPANREVAAPAATTPTATATTPTATTPAATATSAPLVSPPVSGSRNGQSAGQSQAARLGGQAKQTAGRLSGVGTILLSILTALSAVPVVGRPLRGVVNKIRQGQSEVSRVRRMPQQVTRPFEQLGRQSKALVSSPSYASTPVKTSATVQTGTSNVSSMSDLTGTPDTSGAQASVAPASYPAEQAAGVTTLPLNSAPGQLQAEIYQAQSREQVRESEWGASVSFETTVVEPGRQAKIELSIKPAHIPVRRQEYPLRVTCCPVQPAAPTDWPELRGRIQIEKLFAGYRFFPWSMAPLAGAILLLDVWWVWWWLPWPVLLGWGV